MSKKDDKTNVMRLLEQKKISYTGYSIDNSSTNGIEVAQQLGHNVDQVFKTLVTIAPKSKQNYVFVIPVASELDLKKAAKAVNEKSIEMIKQKELLPLTGYIHGGCSPIGMKKVFPTVIHETALAFDTIFFSGGKIGHQVEVNPNDLNKIIKVDFKDLTVS